MFRAYAASRLLNWISWKVTVWLLCRVWQSLDPFRQLGYGLQGRHVIFCQSRGAFKHARDTQLHIRLEESCCLYKSSWSL